jgi:nucleotide-binding universal stress UspA family protein
MAEIVVGVDGSSNAENALRWAVTLGSRRGWTVTAVLAWDTLDQHHLDRERRYRADYGSADAEAALEQYVSDALEPQQAEGVAVRAVSGPAAQVLLDASAEASLLVVGARGLGPVHAAVLGSVSLYCCQEARCPVAIVRTLENIDMARSHRIVVGIDGSGPSRKALAWAVDDARVTGAEVDLVHAWEIPYFVAQPYTITAVPTDEMERVASRVLDEALDGVDTTGLARRPERILIEGSASRSLLDAATGADLVVLGSRGRGGFAGLLLGSVSQQVAHHADCPVVIIPAEVEE